MASGYRQGPNAVLRALGPKTFISYSFRNRDVADTLATFLVEEGFQVRKEDDTSLVGRRLDEELPGRIADAECFIQLLTQESGQSAWVKREFEYAEACAKAGRMLVIIPVALETRAAAAWLGDFAFVDATLEGLSGSVLASIKTIGLSSLRVVRVDDANPLRLLTDDVGTLVDDSQLAKRVLFDSSAYWLRAIDSLVKWGEESAQIDPGARGFVQQTVARRRNVAAILSTIDIVLDPFANLLSRDVADGILETYQLELALGFFYRIVVAKYFFDDLLMLERIASSPKEVEHEMHALRQIAAERDDEPVGLGSFLLESKLNQAIGLALTKVLTGTDLSSYTPERSPATRVSMVIDQRKRTAGGRSLARIDILIPKLAVPFVLGTEVLPHPTAKRWVWALFCLPQVAVRAIEVGGAYRTASRGDALRAVLNGVGWELHEYERISAADGG